VSRDGVVRIARHEDDPGFRPEQVMTLSLVTPTTQRYVDFNQRTDLFDRILERVRTLPGVTAAAFTSAAPLNWTGGGMIGTMPFTRQGVVLQQGVDRAEDRVITPDYFKVLQIPLDRGRLFDGNDGPNASLVAMVNESMARMYWRMPETPLKVSDPRNHRLRDRSLLSNRLG